MADSVVDEMWLNGRALSLSNIRNGNERGRSDFEVETLRVVRAWLDGTGRFEIATSGSTGPPKKVIFHRDQMLASATRSGQALGLREGATSLVCIDTRYIGGMMMIVRSLVHNMRIYAVEPEALPLQHLPVDRCVNFAAFVPYQIHSMLGSKHPHLLDNVDTMIVGGAALHEDDLARIKKLRSVSYATYGMTETISHVALRRLDGIDPPDSFHALADVTLAVDDRECLVISAPYLGTPVTTNDRVDLLDERRFRWLGRWDNVINTGGVKVSPEIVEAAIQIEFAKLGVNTPFFIHGIADRKLGSRVVLVAEAGDDDQAQKLFAALSSLGNHLHKYQMPKEIHLASAFVFTPTGKIHRQRSMQNVTHVLGGRK